MSKDGLARLEAALIRRVEPGGQAEVWIRLPVQLGDMLMALPVVHALQRVWDQVARDHGVELRYVFSGKRSASLLSEAEPRLAVQCLVDEDVDFAVSPWGFWRHWGKRPPIAMINFSKSDRIKLAAWLARVPVRAGISDGANNWAYHFSHSFKDNHAAGHRIFRYQPLLEWLTRPGTQPLSVSLTEQRVGGGSVWAKLTALGWKREPYVVLAVHPHLRAPERQWFPKDQPWIRLSRLIRAEGAVPVLVGGGEHLASLGPLAAQCGGLCLAGDTSLPELAALMAGSIGSVCVDSGPAHLAAATGAPTVVIFGYGSEHADLPNGPRVVSLRGAPAGVNAYDPAASDYTEAPSAWCRATANIPPERAWAVLKGLAAEPPGISPATSAGFLP
jgi:ADP-heptose:LPS heptosyltransferase